MSLSRVWPIIVVLPALLLYGIFVFIPALGNVLISFTDFRGNLHTSIHWVGLDNYKRAITADRSNIGNSIKVTVIFSLLVTLVQNAAAVSLAVLANMKLKLRNFYRAVIFLPNVLGVVVAGLVWSLIFDPFSGPVNSLLKQFGWDSALLGDPKVALYLVIFVMIWMNVGYSMIIYLAGLQTISADLYEAAQIDGAKAVASFFHITLPLLRPSITINFLLSIIGTLLTYDIILVLTNGGPGTATLSLGLYIFQNLSSGLTQGYVSALSIIQFFMILVIVLICQYYLRRREEEL